jgi:hypothetical protein
MNPSDQSQYTFFEIFCTSLCISIILLIMFYQSWVAPEIRWLQRQLDQKNEKMKDEEDGTTDEQPTPSELEIRLDRLGFSLVEPDPQVLHASSWFESQSNIIIIQTTNPEDHWIGCECCGSAHSIRSVIGTPVSPFTGLFGLFCMDCGRGLSLRKDNEFAEADLSKQLLIWEGRGSAEILQLARAPRP